MRKGVTFTLSELQALKQALNELPEFSSTRKAKAPISAPTGKWGI